MTINGRVVDFPMKVGDAGEAFFVFETEQEVPEEFATSPLAGPSPDKVEDEIDFLDLAQGEGGGHVTTQPNDQGKITYSLHLKKRKKNEQTTETRCGRLAADGRSDGKTEWHG